MRVNYAQGIVGLLVLSAGVLMYLLMRPISSLMILGTLGMGDAQPLPPLNDLVWFWGSLPSFLHVLAFSLVTASVGTQSKSNVVAVILLWVALNVVLELGQSQLGKVIASEARLEAYCTPLFSYFTYGTFDWTDILFSILGGVAAYPVHVTTRRGHDYR